MRRYPRQDEKAIERLWIRVTPTEKSQLASIAAGRGVTASAFVRTVLDRVLRKACGILIRRRWRRRGVGVAASRPRAVAPQHASTG